MSEKVVSLVDVSGAVPVADMLEEAAAELRAGMGFPATKAILVLAYHEGEDTVTQVQFAGGVRTTAEAVGLLELGKLQVVMTAHG